MKQQGRDHCSALPPAWCEHTFRFERHCRRDCCRALFSRGTHAASSAGSKPTARLRSSPAAPCATSTQACHKERCRPECRIQDDGAPALFAGGAVRDILRGHEPSDFDVASGMGTAELLGLFPDGRVARNRVGTVVVTERGFRVEITPLRSFAAAPPGLVWPANFARCGTRACLCVLQWRCAASRRRRQGCRPCAVRHALLRVWDTTWVRRPPLPLCVTTEVCNVAAAPPGLVWPANLDLHLLLPMLCYNKDAVSAKRRSVCGDRARGYCRGMVSAVDHAAIAG